MLLLLYPLLAQSQGADTARIQQQLQTIAGTGAYRHYLDPAELNRVAAYIETTFKTYSDSVWVQRYKVSGVTYKNIVCSFGTQHSKRIVVGAHYDVCGQQAGADDNASGTVGLLELARLLQGKTLGYRIDLVAYTLEEPPFFRSENMGSHVHAKYLYDKRIHVLGMVSLEMIGYFSDAKKSQSYPLKFLKLFYGSRGNYITVVQKFGNGKFGRKFKRLMKRQDIIRTKSFKAPARLTGIDFSDHLNYWKYGFRAVMITNTSFYRNKNYHLPTDTIETLDIPKMALVIDEVLASLLAY